MTVPVILLCIGGLCLLAALFGGITGTYSLPTLTNGLRIVAAVLALVFVVAGVAAWVWTESNKSPDVKTPSSPPPSTAPSIAPKVSGSPATAPTINPVRYEKDFTISYINNKGHLDLDGARAWNGDVTEPDDVADVAINPTQVSSENFAKIALSRPGTKEVCEAAIRQEAPAQISIGQVKNDTGFCVESNKGLVAYVTLKDLRSANDDHAALIHVTAFR